MTIYAVGDIHGQFDMLRSVHDLIEADRAKEGSKDAKVVFVGDYCDRGPKTKEVLDWFCDALDDGAPFVCLAGNHDRLMLGFLEAGYSLDPKTSQFDWFAANLGGKRP